MVSTATIQAAQGSHAVLANILRLNEQIAASIIDKEHQQELKEWLSDSFRKITLSVDSEEELINLYNEAKEAGLIVSLIEDNGLTEFNGVQTKTCLAIGPHEASKIDNLTKNLKLL